MTRAKEELEKLTVELESYVSEMKIKIEAFASELGGEKLNLELKLGQVNAKLQLLADFNQENALYVQQFKNFIGLAYDSIRMFVNARLGVTNEQEPAQDNGANRN